MKKKSIGKHLMEEAFKKVTRAMAEQIDKEILEELIRNEKKRIKPRLPIDAFNRLGSKPHSSKKGKKGYNRKRISNDYKIYCI